VETTPNARPSGTPERSMLSCYLPFVFNSREDLTSLGLSL
jgi:hypothetical protein